MKKRDGEKTSLSEVVMRLKKKGEEKNGVTRENIGPSPSPKAIRISRKGEENSGNRGK
jgi:hypothetical protein